MAWCSSCGYGSETCRVGPCVMCHGKIESHTNQFGRSAEDPRNVVRAMKGPSAEVADRIAADKRWKEAEAAACLGRKSMADRLHEFTKRGVTA